jgi:hypothetical protein
LEALFPPTDGGGIFWSFDHIYVYNRHAPPMLLSALSVPTHIRTLDINRYSSDVDALFNELLLVSNHVVDKLDCSGWDKPVTIKALSKVFFNLPLFFHNINGHK